MDFKKSLSDAINLILLGRISSETFQDIEKSLNSLPDNVKSRIVIGDILEKLAQHIIGNFYSNWSISDRDIKVIYHKVLRDLLQEEYRDLIYDYDENGIYVLKENYDKLLELQDKNYVVRLILQEAKIEDQRGY